MNKDERLFPKSISEQQELEKYLVEQENKNAKDN